MITDSQFDHLGAFLAALVAVQCTQGLPTWAWGIFAGNFVGVIVRERRELLKAGRNA